MSGSTILYFPLFESFTPARGTLGMKLLIMLPKTWMIYTVRNPKAPKSATYNATKSLNDDRRWAIARPDCRPTSSRAFSSYECVECRRMAFAWPADCMLYHASYDKGVLSQGLLRGRILVGWISLGPESESVVNDPSQSRCSLTGSLGASTKHPGSRLHSAPSEANIDDTHYGNGLIWPRYLLRRHGGCYPAVLSAIMRCAR